MLNQKEKDNLAVDFGMSFNAFFNISAPIKISEDDVATIATVISDSSLPHEVIVGVNYYQGEGFVHFHVISLNPFFKGDISDAIEYANSWNCIEEMGTISITRDRKLLVQDSIFVEDQVIALRQFTLMMENIMGKAYSFFPRFLDYEYGESCDTKDRSLIFNVNSEVYGTA